MINEAREDSLERQPVANVKGEDLIRVERYQPQPTA